LNLLLSSPLVHAVDVPQQQPPSVPKIS